MQTTRKREQHALSHLDAACPSERDAFGAVAIRIAIGRVNGFKKSHDSRADEPIRRRRTHEEEAYTRENPLTDVVIRTYRLVVGTRRRVHVVHSTNRRASSAETIRRRDTLVAAVGERDVVRHVNN